MTHRFLGLLLPSLLLANGCHDAPAPASELHPGPDVDAADERPPLRFARLGKVHRPIATQSPEAQQWFDQGLALLFGFNHDEAIRSFRAATRLDPGCAMAWWGIAVANGPHINNVTVDAGHGRAAWKAIDRAMGLVPRDGPVPAGMSAADRDLILAQSQRYSDPPATERRPLDERYAAEMRKTWAAHPDDADVGALFAESLMNLQPWDLWTPAGEPKGSTTEILATLERVLDKAPDHPLACHLYIHAVEASREPERGVAVADRLRTLVPDAGHLVHMPAHIYARVGRYGDAAASNVAAIVVDRDYRQRAGKQGFYEVYRAHNFHFLAWAEMMRGRSATALTAARELVHEIPSELVDAMPQMIDGFFATPIEVLVRFGRWQEILDEPEPAAGLAVTRSLRHYARGVALAAMDRKEEAEKEREAFDAAVKRVSEKATVGNNPASAVLEVARHFVGGEVLFRGGKTEEGLAELRMAVAAEDRLVYDEPPGWLEPTRHALGALLLEAGRVEEAAGVYREDLKRLPDNGWSLFGLAECQRRLGDEAGAAQTMERFRKAFGEADVTLTASCFCRREGGGR